VIVLICTGVIAGRHIYAELVMLIVWWPQWHGSHRLSQNYEHYIFLKYISDHAAVGFRCDSFSNFSPDNQFQWFRAFLKKLTVPQLVKMLSAFTENMFTSQPLDPVPSLLNLFVLSVSNFCPTHTHTHTHTHTLGRC